MLIEEYSENFELIVVEVNVGGKEIRIMTGYGPQENWEVTQKMPFFIALEKEVPSGGQIWNQCKWRNLLDNFATNANCAVWWSNL